jgi:hypothetical protein
MPTLQSFWCIPNLAARFYPKLRRRITTNAQILTQLLGVQNMPLPNHTKRTDDRDIIIYTVNQFKIDIVISSILPVLFLASIPP